MLIFLFGLVCCLKSKLTTCQHFYAWIMSMYAYIHSIYSRVWYSELLGEKKQWSCRKIMKTKIQRICISMHRKKIVGLTCATGSKAQTCSFRHDVPKSHNTRRLILTPCNGIRTIQTYIYGLIVPRFTSHGRGRKLLLKSLHFLILKANKWASPELHVFKTTTRMHSVEMQIYADLKGKVARDDVTRWGGNLKENLKPLFQQTDNSWINDAFISSARIY